MKYSKKISYIIFGIVLNLVSTHITFGSQRPPLAPIPCPIFAPKAQRCNRHSQNLLFENALKSEKERVALQDKLLQEYDFCDAEIIRYWTSEPIVRRIEDPKSSFITPKDKIIESLVALDVSLQKEKESTKDMFYRRECDKIQQNFLLDAQQTEKLSAYMNAHKEITKDCLWLAHMYDKKDAIHKKIETDKNGPGCKESYHAWPYIREIAVVKGFIHSGK